MEVTLGGILFILAVALLIMIVTAAVTGKVGFSILMTLLGLTIFCALVIGSSQINDLVVQIPELRKVVFSF